MKLKSLFTDWAKLLGIPVWIIFVAAVVVGIVLARTFGLL